MRTSAPLQTTSFQHGEDVLQQWEAWNDMVTSHLEKQHNPTLHALHQYMPVVPGSRSTSLAPLTSSDVLADVVADAGPPPPHWFAPTTSSYRKSHTPRSTPQSRAELFRRATQSPDRGGIEIDVTSSTGENGSADRSAPHRARTAPSVEDSLPSPRGIPRIMDSLLAGNYIVATVPYIQPLTVNASSQDITPETSSTAMLTDRTTTPRSARSIDADRLQRLRKERMRSKEADVSTSHEVGSVMTTEAGPRIPTLDDIASGLLVEDTVNDNAILTQGIVHDASSSQPQLPVAEVAPSVIATETRMEVAIAMPEPVAESGDDELALSSPSGTSSLEASLRQENRDNSSEGFAPATSPEDSALAPAVAVEGPTSRKRASVDQLPYRKKKELIEKARSRSHVAQNVRDDEESFASGSAPDRQVHESLGESTTAATLEPTNTAHDPPAEPVTSLAKQQPRSTREKKQSATATGVRRRSATLPVASVPERYPSKQRQDSVLPVVHAEQHAATPLESEDPDDTDEPESEEGAMSTPPGIDEPDEQECSARHIPVAPHTFDMSVSGRMLFADKEVQSPHLSRPRRKVFSSHDDSTDVDVTSATSGTPLELPLSVPVSAVVADESANSDDGNDRILTDKKPDASQDVSQQQESQPQEDEVVFHETQQAESEKSSAISARTETSTPIMERDDLKECDDIDDLVQHVIRERSIGGVEERYAERIADLMQQLTAAQDAALSTSERLQDAEQAHESACQVIQTLNARCERLERFQSSLLAALEKCDIIVPLIEEEHQGRCDILVEEPLELGSIHATFHEEQLNLEVVRLESMRDEAQAASDPQRMYHVASLEGEIERLNQHVADTVEIHNNTIQRLTDTAARELEDSQQSRDAAIQELLNSHTETMEERLQLHKEELRLVRSTLEMQLADAWSHHAAQVESLETSHRASDRAKQELLLASQRHGVQLADGVWNVVRSNVDMSLLQRMFVVWEHFVTARRQQRQREDAETAHAHELSAVHHRHEDALARESDEYAKLHNLYNDILGHCAKLQGTLDDVTIALDQLNDEHCTLHSVQRATAAALDVERETNDALQQRIAILEALLLKSDDHLTQQRQQLYTQEAQVASLQAQNIAAVRVAARKATQTVATIDEVVVPLLSLQTLQEWWSLWQGHATRTLVKRGKHAQMQNDDARQELGRWRDHILSANSPRKVKAATTSRTPSHGALSSSVLSGRGESVASGGARSSSPRHESDVCDVLVGEDDIAVSLKYLLARERAEVASVKGSLMKHRVMLSEGNEAMERMLLEMEVLSHQNKELVKLCGAQSVKVPKALRGAEIPRLVQALAQERSPPPPTNLIDNEATVVASTATHDTPTARRFTRPADDEGYVVE